MQNQVESILRAATRKVDEPLNILTCPTHERYENGLTKTGHNFFAYRAQGIKDWNTSYGKIPSNYVLLNPQKQNFQVPTSTKFDLVLSQNKFGQFQALEPLAREMGIPLVSLEHTLPMKEWGSGRLKALGEMRGDINLFISNYSINEWQWEDRGDTDVITHMVDTEVFCPIKQIFENGQLEVFENCGKRNKHILSVVNDWVNRDWCNLPGQKILTTEGYINIEDIKPGHVVLTDNGHYNKVTKTFERDYNGEMVEIKLDGNNTLSFTPDHNIRMFRPNANNQWKYKAVKNLKKGDYVRFPKHIQTDFTINDSEYAWLIGLIIGDGHITKNGAIQISVNKDDYYIAEQAKNILDKITQSTTNISKRSLNKGVYTVECSSKIFGNWLRTKIYNDKQKIIPNFIINSSNKIRTCCLQGLFEADGTFKNGDREKRFVHSTISHKLASQISSIFHSLQVKCSINEEKRDTNKKKNSIIYRIVGYGKENVEWCEQLMTIPFEDNIEESELETGYQYEITNVKKYQYEGKVYNCEVENDHSYVVYPGFVAHNCCNFQGWQRITQDLPVKVLGDTPGLSEPAPSTQALAEEYRTSRIFLNTSTISPIPTALLEGMASGCACVSTATCMIPEIIENGVNGFISNDESELRKYCEMLLEDDELARKLGENAQKTIRENFSPEQFVEKWNLVFNKVLL